MNVIVCFPNLNVLFPWYNIITVLTNVLWRSDYCTIKFNLTQTSCTYSVQQCSAMFCPTCISRWMMNKSCPEYPTTFTDSKIAITPIVSILVYYLNNRSNTLVWWTNLNDRIIQVKVLPHISLFTTLTLCQYNKTVKFSFYFNNICVGVSKNFIN